LREGGGTANAFSSSYDANNRLAQLNGATLAYDSNGSTTNDGTSTYAWDARNQLASVTGPVNATFQYDALGRRVQKAIGSTTTGYQYDSINFVQEQNAAGAVTATLVAGGVDELFGRMTSAGITVLLTDATVEGIAFACLVATENGIKHVPRDAKGQWNAETILKNLKKKKIDTLPSPSIIRQPTEQERTENSGVSLVIEGIPARRLSHDDLIAIYQRIHPWLHEANPYTEPDHKGNFSHSLRT
jgi:YD repeat-containing protein